MNKMQISRLLRGGLFTSHKTNKIYNSPMGQEVDLMSCKRQLPEVLGQQYLLGVVVDAKLPIHIIFLFCDDICFNTHTHTHTRTHPNTTFLFILCLTEFHVSSNDQK